MRKQILIFIGAISFLMLGCQSIQDVTATAETPSIPVIAAVPTVKDITVYLESIGTLQPSILMEIRSQVTGTLKEVLVSEGQIVRKGTPLFRIDSKPYEIKVQEAEAQLAMDQANFKALQKKLARFKDLAQRDLVPQTEWDDLEASAEKAQASIDFDNARLNSAKIDLEHCTLSSPIKGRVGKLDTHPGVYIVNGQPAPLATISKMDPILVEFTVTEKEFSQIPKDTLQFEMRSICSSDSCKTGKASFLDNHFDSKTGLLLIRGKVQNPDLSMRPGQSVNVLIPIATASNAILIPQKAVRYNQQGPYVYVVQKDMTVAVRQLIIGREHGTDQIVLEGIDPSEQIILDGHLRLSPGLKVEIKS